MSTRTVGRVMATLLGVAAWSLAPAAAPGSVAVASTRDTSKSVERVRVDDQGVTIEHKQKHRVHADMEVNGQRVRIGDKTDVHVATPMPGVHVVSEGGQIVRMFANIVVDSTEEVDGDVVALMGSVTVRGHVDGDVVAVLGAVRMTPDAVVEGDAVAIGGGLDRPGGAVVHGQSVDLRFLPMLPDVPPLRAICLALLVLWLVSQLTGGLLAALLSRPMDRVAHTLSERTGWSLLVGLLLPPICVVAALLLLVTLIGIPLAFLLPLIYFVALWVGTVAAAYLLGCKLSGREVGDGGWVVCVLLGSLPVAVLFGVGALLDSSRAGFGTMALLFGLLGLLFATVLSVIGSGAVFMSLLGARQRTVPGPAGAMPPTSPMPPVPPAPPTPPAPAGAVG